MKNFLQNLLIVFALGLCGLMAFQWVRETGLRKQIQELTDKLHDRDESIQALQGTVKRNEAEIQRLDALRIDLNNTIKTNQAKIVELTKNLEKTQNDLKKEQLQVEVFKEALATANQNITKQNEDIKKQNEEMTKLVEERNQVVTNFNKMAADYNKLATEWNEHMEEHKKASTNAPAKK